MTTKGTFQASGVDWAIVTHSGNGTMFIELDPTRSPLFKNEDIVPLPYQMTYADAVRLSSALLSEVVAMLERNNND